MKKIFLSFIILGSVVISAKAQKPVTLDRLSRPDLQAKELNLTDEQKSKIETLNEENKTKMFALRSDSSLTKEQRFEEMKELKNQKDLAIKDILTPEQQAVFSEKKTKGTKRGDRHSNFAQHDNRRKERRGFEDPFKGLNMTEDQKSQIKTLNDDFRKKIQEDRKAHIDAIAKVLTPEQRTQLEEQRNKHHKESRTHRKLDSATNEKLDALRSDFRKQKKSVEMSRVSPDEQKRQIDILKMNYKEQRTQIMKTKNVI